MRMFCNGSGNIGWFNSAGAVEDEGCWYEELADVDENRWYFLISQNFSVV